MPSRLAHCIRCGLDEYLVAVGVILRCEGSFPPFFNPGVLVEFVGRVGEFLHEFFAGIRREDAQGVP